MNLAIQLLTDAANAHDEAAAVYDTSACSAASVESTDKPPHDATSARSLRADAAHFRAVAQDCRDAVQKLLKSPASA